MKLICILRAKLLDLLYPHRVQCVCCGMFSHGDTLCDPCRKSLGALRLNPCDAIITADGYTALTVYQHAGVAAILVRRLKFERLTTAGDLLAQSMTEALCARPLPPDTIITWVPMPEKRLRERGIDHARYLAEAIAQALDLPAKPLLARTGHQQETQRGLTREERIHNLNGAFRATRPLTVPILLVDDVTTTGATLRECTNCLVAAGAPNVRAITATQALYAPHPAHAGTRQAPKPKRRLARRASTKPPRRPHSRAHNA